MSDERCPHCGRYLTNYDFSIGQCLGCCHDVSRDGNKPQDPASTGTNKYSPPPAYERQRGTVIHTPPHKTSSGGKFARFMAVFLLLVCFVFLGLGIEKLVVYEYMESSGYILEQGRNAYVGDDGINRIINTNYAIAYFVLAGFSGLCATTIFIGNKN